MLLPHFCLDVPLSVPPYLSLSPPVSLSSLALIFHLFTITTFYYPLNPRLVPPVLPGCLFTFVILFTLLFIFVTLWSHSSFLPLLSHLFWLLALLHCSCPPCCTFLTALLCVCQGSSHSLSLSFSLSPFLTTIAA